jgi:hypothetical protein
LDNFTNDKTKKLFDAFNQLKPIGKEVSNNKAMEFISNYKKDNDNKRTEEQNQ